MKVLKIIGIIFLSIILLICVGINVWFLAIYSRGEKKIVMHTYKVGLQEKLADTNGDGVIDDKDEVVDAKPFIEILYNTNSSNNGFETFEVKFNYFMDESRADYYSQTLQFVGNYNNSGLSVSDLVNYYAWKLEDRSKFTYAGNDRGMNWMFYDHYWKGFVYGRPNELYGITNYMGSDETNLKSTNPLNEKTLFRIQIGDDLYSMGFAGRSLGYINPTGVKSRRFDTFDLVDTYYSIDPYFLAKILFDSVSTLPNGVHHTEVFEFSKLFTYRKFNSETNSYGSVIQDSEASILDEYVWSYLGIKVTKNETGTQKSEDSLSGVVAGSENMNITDDMIIEDYFIGTRAYYLFKLG